MDVGVIGTGIMGTNHARIYSEMKSVSSVSVYDINKGFAEAVAGKYGCVVYPSITELLSNVEAVSICVPTPQHHSVARQVLHSKRHVLIEKPICSDSGTARTLLQHLGEGYIVGVGHIERFNPVIDEIKKIITAPLYLEFKRHNPSSNRVTGSSVVEDLMIHDIDLLLNVFLPDEEFAIHSVGNADVMSVLMDSDKIPISLSASRKASKKIRTIYIEEESCTIEGDLMMQEIMIYRKPEKYRIDSERYVQENFIEKVMVNKHESLKRELATFIECILSEKPFPVTPEQAIRNLEICEEIRHV